MSDESGLDRRIRRISDNPFLTVTGPLGAGGVGLAMLIFGIQGDLKTSIISQQELRDTVVDLAADVKILTQTANDVVGATFAVETDPVKGAGLMIAHIDKKRKALGI